MHTIPYTREQTRAEQTIQYQTQTWEVYCINWCPNRRHHEHTRKEATNASKYRVSHPRCLLEGHSDLWYRDEWSCLNANVVIPAEWTRWRSSHSNRYVVWKEAEINDDQLDATCLLARKYKHIRISKIRIQEIIGMSKFWFRVGRLSHSLMEESGSEYRARYPRHLRYG